jgi:hypothetical protein
MLHDMLWKISDEIGNGSSECNEDKGTNEI